MTDIFNEFQTLIAILNETRTKYAVCGGWALAIHGVPRATVDIDLIVLPDDLPRVWKIAQGLGYSGEELPLSFNEGIIEIRRISKIEENSTTLYTIDFLLFTEGLKDVWEAKQKIDFENDHVWTVSVEGLIFMKKISGRHKDLGDIESLMELENES